MRDESPGSKESASDSSKNLSLFRLKEEAVQSIPAVNWQPEIEFAKTR